MITGSVAFGNGRLLASLDHDPSVVATDAPIGSLLVNETTGFLWRKLDNGSSINVERVLVPTAGEKAALVGTFGAPGAANRYVTETSPLLLPLSVETYQENLIPVPPVNGNSTRVANAVLDGGVFRIPRSMDFNRIVWRASGQAGAPTARILLYQSADGGFSGPFNLIAQATGIAVAAPGNFETPLDGGGTVTVRGGVCFCLFGRDSALGSVTFRTFVTLSLFLYNNTVPAGVIPTSFTTTIPATGVPAATFDPLDVAVTPSTSDVMGTFILRKV